MAEPTEENTPVRLMHMHATALRVLHDTYGLTWRQLSEKSVLLDEFGNPYKGINFGTLRRIADGHEPLRIDIREQLGLPVSQDCYSCSFRIKGVQYKRKKRIKKVHQCSKKELTWMIENREKI